MENAMQRARRALKEVFGFDSFRPGQQEAVSAILSGRDVMAVMPTGAGKSLCYQIPALVMDGITLVVSPLISLMHDQVMGLVQSGVRAAYINSTLSPRQMMLALDNARRGVYKIIYVAPERLATDSFMNFAKNAQISQIVVDEAHCVSQWGQDFRPGYLGIEPFIRELPVRPVVSAFTATATDNVRRDIVRLLNLNSPYQVSTGFDRPNLYFEVRRGGDRDLEVMRFISEHQGQSGIVYCATRKRVEQVAAMLRQNGIYALGYHAGMSDEERKQAQDDFVADRVPVIVATNAFGMGIDKSNVSFVLHDSMPKDLESYYQEAGRAGRDGEDAVCCLLYQPQDVRLARFLIEHSTEDSQLDEQTQQVVLERAYERLRQMTFYATVSGCLRAKILKYFGETPARDNCGNCSGCLTQLQERDVTREAGLIVACVIAMRGRFGKGVVARVLVGKKTPRISKLELDKLSSFGCLRTMSQTMVREMIDEMIACEMLEQTGGEYPLLKAGPRAREALRGDEPIRMALHEEPEKVSKKRRRTRRSDSPLYERLAALRRRIADEQHVPPFVIFANATLHDMAERVPTNRAAMLRVAGVGERKMERYGEAFLAEIRRYEEELR